MIDWDQVRALREEVGPEDFAEVVELFLMEVDAEIEALQAVAAQGGLGEKLHFLKGSAMNLGFSDFSSLCQAGESRLAENTAAPIDIEAILASYRASRDHFLAELPQVTAS
jgi:HPt (histidine-containing phosphotransfer) domain-containing protein